MTTREFLEQYKEADKIARRLRAEYEKELYLIDTVKSVSDIDGMPHGNGINKAVEDKAIRLADKAAVWKMAELEALHLRQEVFELVYDIPGDEGDILYERYVYLRKWKDVCKAVHLSWESVRKHHKRALDLVDQKIKNSTM